MSDSASSWRHTGFHARHVDTESVPTRERFELWRSLFAGVHLESPEGVSDAPFWGELTRWMGRGGVLFEDVRFDQVVARFATDESNGAFLLTRLMDGRVEMHDGAGSSSLATEGFFLLDTRQPIAMRCDRCAFASLRLPRALVLDAIGGDPMPSKPGISKLPDEGLARVVSSQLGLLSERGPALDDAEREVALEASVDLALALLRERLRLAGARDGSGQALFTAARLHIERHFHRPDVTPEQIAEVVGCSRARLYRAFAEQSSGVLELIRETRLQWSQDLLKASPDREISEIALECGYTDPPAFTRAFKRRFGQSPTEWRAMETP